MGENDDELLNLHLETKREVENAFHAIEWAEAEIEAAKKRHPDAADQLHRCFGLLTPTFDLLIRTEFTYRSHCRELLERVAAGEDTRPATAAECCVALSEVSQVAPFNTTAAGLYVRMWKLADMPAIPELTDSGVHYEALEGAGIDDAERWLRKKLGQSWRVPEASNEVTNNRRA